MGESRRSPGLAEAFASRAWVAIVALHLFGIALTLLTVRLSLELRLLLEILGDRVGLGWPTPIVVLALVCVVGVSALVATIRRLREGLPARDVSLHLRAAVYFTVGCVLVCVFVLSTPEALAGPFRVRHPIVAEILAALTYGGWALWSLTLPWLRRALPRPLRRGIDVPCANVVVASLLLEASLRLLALVWANPILVTDATPSPIRRDSERQQPGSLRFGFPMNSGGHYDTEFLPPSPARGPTIVSIGDSFCYGTVPHAYHFTTVAEQELGGVEIYNMGFPGTGPAEYAFLLERQALPLEPDLVVVQLFIGNDLLYGAQKQVKRWYDAESYLAGVLWYRWQILRALDARAAGHAAPEGGVGARDPAEDYPWVLDPFLEVPPLSEEVHLNLEVRNALAVCVENEALYSHHFRQLTELVRVAGDVPLAFVLIPDEFQVEDWLWEAVQDRSDTPLDRDLPQRRTREWLDARRLPVLDLLPMLRGVEPMRDGRRHLYHSKDTHFNARGNRVAGLALATFVSDLLPGEREPSTGSAP